MEINQIVRLYLLHPNTTPAQTLHIKYIKLLNAMLLTNKLQLHK